MDLLSHFTSNIEPLRSSLESIYSKYDLKINDSLIFLDDYYGVSYYVRDIRHGYYINFNTQDNVSIALCYRIRGVYSGYRYEKNNKKMRPTSFSINGYMDGYMAYSYNLIEL